MFEAQLVAFSTASSVAALPINLKNTEHSLGVKKSITNFVLPLGATVNMNGLASTIGVIAIFAANLYGIQLSIGDMITITITSVIAAIGAAGVPAAGIVVLPMVLGSVGIPLDVIGLIVAINRILDMMSTTTNITGDTFAAVLVAKSENELDTCIYNNQEQESFHPITIPEPKKV
jgi:Na+/H+-dicarboxylate symporter